MRQPKPARFSDGLEFSLRPSRMRWKLPHQSTSPIRPHNEPPRGLKKMTLSITQAAWRGLLLAPVGASEALSTHSCTVLSRPGTSLLHRRPSGPGSPELQAHKEATQNVRLTISTPQHLNATSGPVPARMLLSIHSQGEGFSDSPESAFSVFRPTTGLSHGCPSGVGVIG